MRLRELHIENFGIHRERQWPLASAVQVIYGPNEAGKSTLLQLLRHLLFGIHTQTPYLKCSADGPLAARAEFVLRGGRTGWYRRQKSNPDKLTGQVSDGTEITSQKQLEDLLGGAGQALYENVFAFSSDELRSGAASLKQARLDEALYGGGIGGLARFQAVQTELESRLANLFNPSARATKPLINVRLRQLKEAQDRYRKSLLRGPEYDQLQERLQAHSAAVEEIERQRDGLQCERERLDRLQQALPEFRQLSAARENRARIVLPAGLTADITREFRTLGGRRKPLADEVGELTEKLLRAERPPDLSAEENAVLAAAERIALLYRELARVQELSASQPELQRVLRGVDAELEQFQADWGGRRPPEIALPQREAIRALADEDGPLRLQTAKLRDRRDDLDKRLGRARREFERLDPAEDAAAWSQLTAGARRWVQQRERRQSLQAEQGAAERELERRGQQLRAALPGAAELSTDMPTPLRATVEQFRERWKVQDGTVSQINIRLEDARSALKSAQQALADWDRTGTGDERSKVVQLRARREAGWALLRRKYLEPRTAADSDAAIDADIDRWTDGQREKLADLYAAAVAAADLQADQALSHAEWHAKRNRLSDEIENCEQRCADLADDAAAAQSIGERLSAEWRACWATAGIEPRTPAEMLEWLDGYAELSRLCEQAAARRRDLDQLQAEIAQFEQELVGKLPEGTTSPEAVVSALELRVAGIQRTESDRERLNSEIGALQQESDQLRDAEQQAAQQRGAWQHRLEQLLTELDLPRTLDLESLQRIVRGLEQVQALRKRQVDLSTQVAHAGGVLEEFRAAVQAVAAECAASLVNVDPVAAAEELGQKLSAARTRRERCQQSESQRAGDQRLLDHKAAELRQVDDSLEALCRRAGVATTAVLEAAAERFDEAVRHEGAIHASEQKLQMLFGTQWETVADWKTLTPGELSDRVQRIDQDLKELRETYQTESQQRGAVMSRLEALAVETDSLTRGAELEALRAGLANEVDQWAPLALTQALMQRALKRFEQQHQPRLLIEVGRLLARLTGGEHVAIRRTLGSSEDAGDLQVEDRLGRRRAPDQLSTGARMQLYLAIRLAFAIDYCQNNEPLPLVLDDVLVHFDEGRARNTLEVLSEEVSPHAQVLLLTCHQRTAELWQDVRSDSPYLELQPREGGDTGERSASDSTTSARKRRKRRTTETDGSLLFPPG